MKKRLTVLISVAALAAMLGGCGYKAPPYYEKPPKEEGRSGAL